MRLFAKIFICGTLTLSLSFSVSGYLLLHFSMESSMARETDFALKQYQYDKFTVQSALLTYADFSMTVVVAEKPIMDQNECFTFWEVLPEAQKQKELPEELFEILAEEISLPVAFYREDKTPLYEGIEGLDVSFLENLSEGAHAYRFQDTPEGGSVLVGSVLEAGGKLYFLTQWDIGKTLVQQETLERYFLRCYLIAILAGMLLLGFLSAFLTGSLKRMSRAARRMAQGDYQERLAISGRDEIGELAESFNQMAGAVEEKVAELSRAARQKEDFVANFAHEMKTPMTSIIGYADMLYQKELTRQQVRDASWYIWNEGMRLETLSLKLMDLTVLGRQDFTLQEMDAEDLFRDVSEGLRPLFAEKGISFSLSADPAYIKVEYDLLKTLLINLMDNSMKAGCSRIELSGRRLGEGIYRIGVRDDGCGMEEEELSRITEAFYMVDKARSRKQHGAGLGLALAERIAGIHKSRLTFRSRKGMGTEVSLEVVCGERAEDEE